MSKPLAMNMYVQNATGIFVPLIWPAYTADGVAFANIPEVGIGINSGSGVNRVLSPAGQGDANTLGSSLPVGGWLYTGGNVWDRQRTPNVFKKLQAVSVTAGTPVAVWTPAAGKKFRMMGFILATTVAGSILMEDATGGANEFHRVPLLTGTTAPPPPIASPPLGNGYLSTTANNALFIDVTVTGVVSGVIYGTEE